MGRNEKVEKANLSKGMHLEEGARKDKTKANWKARGMQEEREREGEGRNGGGRLYNWAQGRRQAQNGKRSAGGASAHGGNLLR